MSFPLAYADVILATTAVSDEPLGVIPTE